MSNRPSRFGEFATKFRLALEALNLSRARCAQALGVDKSVVTRWANGSALPTEHNLTRITALIQRIRPEATLGMWRIGLDDFASYLGPVGSGRTPTLLAEPPVPRDRASVAVLAFDNLSGDPEQEHFSDGMAEDIITALSRYRSLLVIARNSSFTYKGRAVDVTRIASELGVRYVVEGSVRRANGNIRVSAQLIDAESGGHVWAERYDRTLADMFAVQDEITNAVALAIEPAISLAEQRRAMGASPDNLAAWETYHRALSHLARGSDAEVARARELFQRATELDELFAPAHALLAVVCLMETGRGLRKPQDSLRLAEMHVRRAMELDPYDSVGPTALAWLLLANGDHDAAVEQAERALALNQNDARPHYVKGRALAFSGRTVAARDALLTSLRLNPRDPFNQAVMAQIAFSYYLERDYAAAVEAVRRAIRDFAQFPMSYPWYAAALAQLGRTEQAQAVLGRVLAEFPSAVELYTRGCPAWVRPQDHEHLLDGLRKAGWRAD